ncbi:hypothetical protein PHYBOEH_006646 [Phytophthora boehmeriae]|uniref:Protein NO VEIN C-terminal domain-containing protein n=1 Tax=Phytophthora boehmeriae TaxID=109152 RepID=A0A8T1WGX6_9STRA|nr:hypothetical protein PHYBOEH_006646 [Phytophthora boehmeriae]
MRQPSGGRGGRSNWSRYQQQQHDRGFAHPQPPQRSQQSYYQSQPPLPPSPTATTGQIQRDVVAFIEGFRANRSNLSTPPNAITLDVVVRAICSHFCVNTFEDLMGTSALQLPVLRQLHTVNQRVWTFVTCFMQSRRVNTLFECHQAFLQHEGIRSFHELKIGNSFLHTEAVQSLYRAPVAMMNITTREVLACLKQFETMLGHDAFRASSHIDLNEFLQYLAQQYRQPSAQAMGVSIDPSGFGVYVGMLRRVANQEMKEMKNIEQEFQREVAEKVFQLTKEKFSTDNRQQALEDLLEQTNARSTPSSGGADDKGKKARGGKKDIMQSLSLDMLKRVTDVDVYLDNVLRRKAAADAKNQNKYRKPISSQEIAETDTKLRNQLTRFLVSSQKSKHHSRLKVVTWVICSIMAKTYALLLSDDKLPDEVAGGSEEGQAAATVPDSDKEECDCCCVGKDTCTCSCSCSCHVDSSDEESDENHKGVEEKAGLDNSHEKTSTSEDLPTKPTQASTATSRSEGASLVDAPLEEVRAEIENFLGSQLSKDNDLRTSKDVLLLLSSLESHLTGKFGVKSSTVPWAGRQSMLQLLGEIVGESEENCTDNNVSTDRWLVHLMGLLGKSDCQPPHNGHWSRQEGVLPFIRECLAVITSSSSLSSLPSEKQQQWIERRICVEFGCARVKDLGLSSLEEAIKIATQDPVEGEITRSSIINYASVVDVTRDCGADDAIARDGVTGESMQLKFLTDEALAKLRHCPCLVDVSLFMNWQEQYAPLCGPLLSFIRMHEMILFDHASSSNTFMFVCCLNGTILRVNEKSTPSDLELLFTRAQQASVTVAPSQVAVHLVSMLVTCRSESNFPTQLVQAHLRAYLSHQSKNRSQYLGKEGKQDITKNYAERFVLEILLEAPVDFTEFVLPLLLAVLGQATGTKSSDEWGIADGIWNTCRNDVERKTLVLISKRNSSPLWASQTRNWCDLRENLTAAYNDGDAEMSNNEDSSAVERGSTSVSVTESDSVVRSVAFSNTFEEPSFTDSLSHPDGGEPPQSEQHDADSCRLFIDDLRKKQFGVGLEIQDEATNSVLLIQQQRLERALKRLSDELYSESTHFVLELLQNADDNAYDDNVVPRGEFTLTEKQDIVFYNNERGFSPANIQAICDVGASTKGAADSETSIGKKGIGFKSVFKVSDNPQVHSNGFHICFHAKNAEHGTGMGYILPYWLEDVTRWQQQRGTTFVLPLNDASVQRVNDISQSLMTFEPSVLLFLRRIRELRLRDEGRRHALHFLKKEKELQTNVQTVQLYSRSLHQDKTDVDVAQQNWLVVKEKLEPPPLFGRDCPTEIAIAFPIAPQQDSTNDPADRPPLQQVFAYLPLRSYGFRFILQGDFEIPSSREAITNGSEWNEWVVSKFPKLVRAAVSSYVAGISSLQGDKANDTDVDEHTEAITAISHLVSLLPLDNEVQAPFRRIIPEIMRELRQVRWLVCASSNQPSSILELCVSTELIDCTELAGSDISASMSALLEALEQDTLSSVFSKRFLHPTLSRRMPPLLKSQLRIEQLHSSHVMRVLSLSVDKNDIDWTVKMLALLAKLWRKDRHSSLLRQELRLIKCFPLQRTHKDDTTKWISLAEGHDSLFVSPGQVGNSTLRQFTSKQSYEFYGDLRILDEAFTEATRKSSKLYAFLMNDVGIHVMEDHDVIRHHIIPKMKELREPSDKAIGGKASDSDAQALLEYGSFLSSHLSLCASCPMREDVKANMVVVTSTSNLVRGDAANLFVILPSIFKSMPRVASWIADKIGQNKECFAIASSAYFAQGDNSSDHISVDTQWRQLFVEVCELPLLISCTGSMSSAHGIEQVLKWIEQEDDAILKRTISAQLSHYFDNHWEPRKDSNSDSMGVRTNDDSRVERDSSYEMWRKYQWLEGSDGQFYHPTELWLSNDLVTRLFTTDMVTFTSMVWKNEDFSKHVLGMKSTAAATDVLPVISNLSVDSTLMPTLKIDHMIHLYIFLWEESQRSDACREEITTTFKRKMLLFVPAEDNESGRRFVGPKNAVWSSTTYSGDLVVLETLYPKSLCAFFTEICGVQRKPSVSLLCEMIAGQQGHLENRRSSDSDKKKLWKKTMLPILRELSKKVKKQSLSKVESRAIKKILKSTPWLPARSLTCTSGSELAFCSTKEQPVQAQSEIDRKLQKLIMSLAKEIAFEDDKRKKCNDADIKVAQLEASSDDAGLGTLLDFAKISTLTSHVETHASTWCKVLASFAAQLTSKKDRKKLVKLEQLMIKIWASKFSTASDDGKHEDDEQFQWNLQHLKLFPTIDENFSCMPAADMYINDQVDLPKSDLQQQIRLNNGQSQDERLSVLGLFSWGYFVENDRNENDSSDAVQVRKFLVDFCGMRSLKEHLQHEVSVLSTQRVASGAFLGKVRAALALAQRFLFHNHRRLYDQLQHDNILQLATQLQCVLVDGHDGFQVVYRVGNSFSLRRGADALSRCFLDVSNCTLYIQAVTGDEEGSALSPVLMELSKKLFGAQVASSVANLLYLSSLQASPLSREQWLTETQLLPPISVNDVERLWVEQEDDKMSAALENSSRKRDSECLEDGEIEGEEVDAKRLYASLRHAPYNTRNGQMPGQGGSTTRPPFYPPLPSSDTNYEATQHSTNSFYGHQFPPPPSQSTNPSTDGAPSYPPLPAPASGPGMSSLSLANTMTKEEREAIGRWGEEYVFNQLKQQHADDETNLTVDWVNEQEESGLPYDLTLSSGGKVVEYIEVKSTRTMEKGVFEISMNELDQAAIHGSTYSIYRVFNAGNPALCRVIRMKNPVSLVRQRKIQLALVMQ